MTQAESDIERFIGSILNETHENMIYLVEQEATAMERRCYRVATADPNEEIHCRRYAEQLKEFLIYARSNVAQGVVGNNPQRYLSLIKPNRPTN